MASESMWASDRDMLSAECARLTAERDAALTDKHCLRLELEQVRVRCNEAREERDAAELERTESRAEVVRLRYERDAALTEAEGLRADLLAHPPEHAARIAELEAELAQVRYERDAALAGSKERQTANAALWEAQQDMQRKAGHDQMIIEGLRECLEKTEKRYIEVKARQVPRALVGLLGVIRREAAAAEKMILWP